MFSRPPKLSHLDTVQYEIDMLNYCHEKLLKEEWQNTLDNYISLERFLLHYRNLIEFFGDAEDLKVSEFNDWSPRILSAEELASISNKEPLEKYRGQFRNTYNIAPNVEQGIENGTLKKCMGS